MGKARAYVVALILIMLLFFGLIILHVTGVEITDVPVGAFLAAIVSLTTAYMVNEVANNGVRGKFYRPELDKENKNDRAKG